VWIKESGAIHIGEERIKAISKKYIYIDER